jgi:hypothetical protein
MGDPISGPSGWSGHWVTLPDGRRIHIESPEYAEYQRKSKLAKASYNPMDKKKMAIAMKQQQYIADLVGGRVIPDNEAFDVIAGNHLIEVKSIISAKNDKLTVHPLSLRRKTMAAQLGLKRHWIVGVDVRYPGRRALYLWPNVGSFRFGRMLPTPPEVISQLFRGRGGI